MKKKYIKPQLCAYNISRPQLLAASDPVMYLEDDYFLDEDDII